MAAGTQGPGHHRNPARARQMGWRVGLVAVVCLGLGFCAGTRFERFMQVDRCLDAGGRFDAGRGLCER